MSKSKIKEQKTENKNYYRECENYKTCKQLFLEKEDVTKDSRQIPNKNNRVAQAQTNFDGTDDFKQLRYESKGFNVNSDKKLFTLLCIGLKNFGKTLIYPLFIELGVICFVTLAYLIIPLSSIILGDYLQWFIYFQMVFITLRYVLLLPKKNKIFDVPFFFTVIMWFWVGMAHMSTNQSAFLITFLATQFFFIISEHVLFFMKYYTPRTMSLYVGPSITISVLIWFSYIVTPNIPLKLSFFGIYIFWAGIFFLIIEILVLIGFGYIPKGIKLLGYGIWMVSKRIGRRISNSPRIMKIRKSFSFIAENIKLKISHVVN
ncbi:MAG: hypothetical protein ACFFDF_12330, partial [Candidatus Odinarchaeota archaeon]